MLKLFHPADLRHGLVLLLLLLLCMGAWHLYLVLLVWGEEMKHSLSRAGLELLVQMFCKVMRKLERSKLITNITISTNGLS